MTQGERGKRGRSQVVAASGFAYFVVVGVVLPLVMTFWLDVPVAAEVLAFFILLVGLLGAALTGHILFLLSRQMSVDEVRTELRSYALWNGIALALERALRIR